MPKNDKSRIRVFFADFEGSDATIKEGLKAIADAVNKTFEPKIKIVNLSPELKEGSVNEILEVSGVSDLNGIEENPGTPKSKTGKTTSKAPVKTYTLVEELDLLPQDKQSLREFYEEKKTKRSSRKNYSFYLLPD